MHEQTYKPLVSVITVVYNDVLHIEETIQSVLNQTYSRIEYIVIDGGSTDGTVDIIRKYSSRLAYWSSGKDKGIADAMNKGLEYVTGEWVNFINSGDYFIANTIFEEIFTKPHTADMLYGSFIGNFNGKSVKCIAHPSATDKAWRGMRMCHSTLFANADIIKRFKFDTSYRDSADNEFVTRCVAEGCTFERLELVIFRVGTLGNSSAHWLRARVENWRIARKYFPGIQTEWYHLSRLVREVSFRTIKKILSLVGVYQLLRYVYRKKFEYKYPLLPKGSEQFHD